MGSCSLHCCVRPAARGKQLRRHPGAASWSIAVMIGSNESVVIGSLLLDGQG
jgi:hypothetical protein